MRNVRCLVMVALTVAGLVVGVKSTSAAPAAAADAEPAWVSEMNVYRKAAGLRTVTEDPSLTAAIKRHLDYL
jgi:hypothetical protein